MGKIAWGSYDEDGQFVCVLQHGDMYDVAHRCCRIIVGPLTLRKMQRKAWGSYDEDDQFVYFKKRKCTIVSTPSKFVVRVGSFYV